MRLPTVVLATSIVLVSGAARAQGPFDPLLGARTPSVAAAPAVAPPTRQAPSRTNPGSDAARKEATRLSYLQARGGRPPNGYYVNNPKLTRAQNCQAMTANGQWTQARAENPCKKR